MHGHRRRNLTGLVVLLLVGALSAVGCSDGRDVPALCDAYSAFLSARQEVRQLDPESMSADQVEAAADDYLAAINSLQQAADGRYAAPLGVLEEAVADVQRSAANVPSDSDAATWLPLVRDDLETAAKASASVTNQIGATCPSA